MGSYVEQSGFTPYIGEGFISPNRQLVTDLVKGMITNQPSFARAIQKRCLGSTGRMALPVTFMSKYLSGSQGQVVLEDDDGLFWKVDWIAYMQSGRRLAFTRGWPAFVAYHDVKDGDVLIAEIMAPDHFKVQFISGLAQASENVTDIKDVNGYRGDKEPHFLPMPSGEGSYRDSPLAFLSDENKIARRKRSRKMTSMTALDLVEGPSKALKHVKEPSLVQKGWVSEVDNVSPGYMKDSIHSVRAGTTFCGGVGTAAIVYDKKKIYEAQYCQYTKEPCLLYVLHGFKFCMLHILEDSSAPYKQCDFVEEHTRARCGFSVCLNLVDTRFCQVHKQKNVKESSIGEGLQNILPNLGTFSSLMMAAVVAHQSFEEANFWVCTDSKSAYNEHVVPDPAITDGASHFLKGNRASMPVHPCRETDLQLASMKVNAENIACYIGWKPSAAANRNSEFTYASLAKREAIFDGEGTEASTEYTVHNSAHFQVSYPSLLNGNDFVHSRKEWGSKVEMKETQHGPSTMQGNGKHVCSKFVGVRRRPWGAYGAEIRTPEGKRLWLGTFATEQEAALAYNNAARIFHGESITTNFVQGKDGHVAALPSEPDWPHVVKQRRAHVVALLSELDHPHVVEQRRAGMFSDAPKRRRTLVGKKRSRITLICPPTDGVELGEVDKAMNLDDSTLDPELEEGLQCLVSMQRETDFFKLGENLARGQEEKPEHRHVEGLNEEHSGLTERSTQAFELCKGSHKNDGVSYPKTALKQQSGHIGVECGETKQKRRFKSLSLALPGTQELESDSDDSIGALCGLGEPKVAIQLHKRFMELKEEHGNGRRSFQIDFDVSASARKLAKGKDFFTTENRVAICSGFETCRKRISPGKLEVMETLEIENKKPLSLNICL